MSRTTGNGQTPVTIADHKHLVLRWAKISVFEPQGHDLDIAGIAPYAQIYFALFNDMHILKWPFRESIGHCQIIIM